MTNLDQFKVKTPLWSYWLGQYRAWQRARAARKAAVKQVVYIATIYEWILWTNKNYYACWYICQEKNGKRFYEYGYDSWLEWHFKDKQKFSRTYPFLIKPWLLRRYTNQQLIDYAAKQKIPENKTTS